jgi:hypothetical protein
LRGETADDIELLVRWLYREKRLNTEVVILSYISFSIGVENVKQLLRLADKFEIPYLMSEIKVPPYPRPIPSTNLQIFAAHWITLVTPSYELWELGARYELDYLEKFCRQAARSKADQILANGAGLNYFLDRGIPIYMIDGMIRALFKARESVIQTDYKGNRVYYL